MSKAGHSLGGVTYSEVEVTETVLDAPCSQRHFVGCPCRSALWPVSTLQDVRTKTVLMLTTVPIQDDAGFPSVVCKSQQTHSGLAHPYSPQ